ncbi:MAG: MGMT family protein [Marinoscillum sp.]
MEDSRSNFFADVHEVVRLIPVGRVTSYGAIANYLGLKSGARMVGWAMNAAHSDHSIPAHRVVNRIGLLSGKHNFTGGSMVMEELLRAEGVIVENDKIQGFKKVFWDPNVELKL